MVRLGFVGAWPQLSAYAYIPLLFAFTLEHQPLSTFAHTVFMNGLQYLLVATGQARVENLAGGPGLQQM